MGPTLHLIYLLSKCSCDLCKKEKEKLQINVDILKKEISDHIDKELERMQKTLKGLS